MRETLGCDPLFGDVLDVGDRQRDAVLLDHRHLGLGPDELAVAAQIPLLDPVAVVDAELDTRPFGGCGTQVVRVRDLAHRPTEQVAARVIEQVGERLVCVDDAVVGQPNQRHSGRRRVERLLEPPSRLLQRFRGPLPVADVAEDHHGAAPVVGNGVQGGFDQPGRTVPADEFERRRSASPASASSRNRRQRSVMSSRSSSDTNPMNERPSNSSTGGRSIRRRARWRTRSPRRHRG